MNLPCALSVRLLALGIYLHCGLLTGQPSESPYSYKNDWTSLRQHQSPQWLLDAKFGIYCHWGIQTLQYIPEYADLSDDERIALFKGDHFDADQWAEVFERAGAKFGGVIGWHGSDFKHWDSQYSDYTSAKMGPKIDIVGEVSKAVKKRGLKFLVSYHSIKGDDWLPYAKEGVDKYDPDIFWVDASFGGTKGGHHRKTLAYSKFIGMNEKSRKAFAEKYQREFITYFYNNALQKGKEVEFMYKSHDIPPGVGMRDLENGILPRTPYDTWITDMDMSVPPDWETHGWFYREGIPLRSANELVDMLVDVVSKNGIFLLNIPPKADGTFPEEVVETLATVGDWLDKNGEAIYQTSPWFLYGQGPAEIPEGNYIFHHNNHFAQIAYTRADIRFTVKGNNLYATCLGKPESSFSIEALNSSFKVHEGDIVRISHLGSGKEITFEHTPKALILNLEGLPLDDKANAFKIELDFGL
ncbi:MAG: alpha-L-fucosidase [Bacteroidota bacterium]